VEVESGRILPDKVETGYARGFAFASDKGGFYYCHEVSAASEDHTIRLHRFQKPKTDQAIFRVARSRGSRLVLISDRFYLGAIWVHHYGEDLVADFQIASKNTPENWKRVFVNRKLPYTPFLNNGHVFVLSYRDAPRGKLVELTHDGSELRIVVPEQDAIIRQFVISGESIFISCFQNMAFQFGSEFVWKRFGTNRYSYRWNDPVAPQSKSRRSQRFLHS
jgi:protease II